MKLVFGLILIIFSVGCASSYRSSIGDFQYQGPGEVHSSLGPYRSISSTPQTSEDEEIDPCQDVDCD